MAEWSGHWSHILAVLGLIPTLVTEIVFNMWGLICSKYSFSAMLCISPTGLPTSLASLDCYSQSIYYISSSPW